MSNRSKTVTQVIIEKNKLFIKYNMHIYSVALQWIVIYTDYAIFTDLQTIFF